jgi:hypothetical protein
MNTNRVKYTLSPIDLKPHGVNNILFDRIDALQVVDLLSGLGIPILGSDVYVKEDQGYNVTYDNWFCDQESDESFKEFVLRSCLVTKAYIENYDPNSHNYYFALVVR